VSTEALAGAIAPLNAALNLASTLLLLTGLYQIRQRNPRAHQRAMTAALIASALFLVFYVIRFSLTGTHRFAGEGLAKGFYLTILFSHMILAALIVPLVLRLVYLVRRRRFHAHARLARWTYPIWLYVSVTGLIVYAMLYHVYGWV
jgi:uncharacterized membrane protein YozB (DUF420 family)